MQSFDQEHNHSSGSDSPASLTFFAARLQNHLRRVDGKKSRNSSLICRKLNNHCRGLDPVSPETVRRWLRGISYPDLPNLARLSSFLGVCPGLLLSPEDACPGAANANSDVPPEEWVAGAIESLSRLDENKRRKVLELIAALAN